MCNSFKLGNIKNDDIIDLWKNSNILQKIRKLNVNNFSKNCKECSVKYYCVGGCKEEALYANKNMESICPYCKDIKQSIIDLMFELGNGNNELFNNRIKYFR